MLNALNNSIHTSNLEPPTIAPSHLLAHSISSKGRPRKEIDQDFLANAIASRNATQLAEMLGCSTRTVRRRLLEYNICQPGDPVFTRVEDPSGNVVIRHNPTHLQTTNISDEHLDEVMHEILTTFPNFGQQMIAGHLASKGYRATRDRVRSSYRRVHGAPAAFGRRRIQRREYRVAGPNALWHHDGQHGKLSKQNQPRNYLSN